MEGFLWVRPSFRSLLLGLSTLFPSFLRVLVLKALGARVGRGTRIYPLAVLVAEEIEIGNDTVILPFSVILNLRKLKLGNRCFIHWGAMIAGHGRGSLIMGDFSYVGLRSVVNCTEDVTIGSYTCIGPRAIVYTHGNYLSTYRGYPNKFGSVKIGNSSWLNVGSIVLPGVTIGDNTIIKPGCVVSRDVGSERILQFDHRVSYVERSVHEAKQAGTPEYVSAWYESLFDQLAAHLGETVGVETLGPRRWRISFKNQTLEVIYAPARPDGLDPGRSLLLLSGLDAVEKAKLSRVNWIDFETNECNLIVRSELLRLLLGYFELRKGIHLTRFESRFSLPSRRPAHAGSDWNRSR